ncbi:ATP-binding protein [bacterium]|nr:ATP-binding protein [bacterium]
MIVASHGNTELLKLHKTAFLCSREIPASVVLKCYDWAIEQREKGSVIITTNKAFEQWGDIFTDNILASAIIDRIVHYSTVIKINGHSYRAKNLKKEGGGKV